ENLCYVVSVLVAISIGGALLWVALGHSVQPMLIVAAAGLGALAAFGLGAAFLASRWHARAVVDRFQTVRRRIATIAVLETAFHVAAVAEIAIVVGAMAGVQPSVVSAAILEMANRVTTVAFQFLPLRLGVDEAVSGLTAEWLRVGAPIGVGVALVRKGRVLCWSAIGFSLAAFLGGDQPGRDDSIRDGADASAGRSEAAGAPSLAESNGGASQIQNTPTTAYATTAPPTRSLT